MTDKASTPTDRVSEIQERQSSPKLNVVSAGLNPCAQEFNDEYKLMLGSQLEKITGKELNQDMLNRVEDRLGKNGFKLEDIASAPDKYQSVMTEALTQAQNDLEIEQAG